MQFIKHRLNTQNQLKDLAANLWGAEIDLRSDLVHGGKIHLSHDPWVPGEDFETWLGVYATLPNLSTRAPLILNTKEDGLEARALELLKNYKIQNYFFLDTALPTLIKWTHKESLNKFALRISKYESVPSSLVGKVEWLWVDCFEGEPLAPESLGAWAQSFKICLVSPELQGQSLESIAKFQALRKVAHAVCTKNPERWLNS